jgi:flagellar biosynthesis component FlhA
MHFSEDDLRAMLKRKDPGEGFTQRVMAGVEQAKAEGKTQPANGKSNGFFLAWWKLSPAWTFAVVALLLLGFAWGGYQLSEYHHREEMRVAAERQRQLEEQQKQLQAEAEKAKAQAILALEIARSKLNHVLQQAQLPAAVDKIRRQRL